MIFLLPGWDMLLPCKVVQNPLAPPRPQIEWLQDWKVELCPTMPPKNWLPTTRPIGGDNNGWIDWDEDGVVFGEWGVDGEVVWSVNDMLLQGSIMESLAGFAGYLLMLLAKDRGDIVRPISWSQGCCFVCFPFANFARMCRLLFRCRSLKCHEIAMKLDCDFRAFFLGAIIGVSRIPSIIWATTIHQVGW